MANKDNKRPVFLGRDAGSVIQSIDWSDHALGPYEEWPSSLCTTMSVLLSSSFPMALYWGTNHVFFYNDAFRSFLRNADDSDSEFMGKRGEDVWLDRWPPIKDEIDNVWRNEETRWSRNQIPDKSRNGTTWDAEFSPVKDKQGEVTGILVICKESSATAGRNLETSKDDGMATHILENISDGFYGLNKNWIITKWNPKAEELLDIKREEVLGENIWDALPAGKELKLYPEYRKVMKKRVSSTFEEYYEPWGRWFAFNVYPSSNGISAYFRDITEQRRLQLINKRTEEISGVAGWEYDVATEEVFLTPKAYEIYGLPEDEQIDLETNEQLFDEESLQTIEETLKRAIEKHESYEIELILQREHGEDRIIKVNGFPQIENEKVTKLYGTLEDITQKKREQEQLEEANKRLKTSQRIARLGYWTHDIAKNESEWSEEVYDIWEVDPETFTPNFDTLLETIHPKDRDMFLQDANNVFPGQDFYDSEHRIITPEGKVKWIMERITLHRDEDGNPRLMEGIAQDITEKKEQEQELREALKEKETLLAEVHHRVKNNLAVVSGMMQLQAYEEEDSELKEKLLDSVVRIISMASIHEQLYRSGSFSKLNFSENLKVLVQKILDAMQVNTEIRLNFDLDPIRLNVNQAVPCSLIINEVVTNILKHAFKDVQAGDISFDLTINNGQITLSIQDNGVGFPEDIEVTDKSTLGLRLIDILAEQLEADYHFDSAPGEGTTFTIQFEKSNIKGAASSYV